MSDLLTTVNNGMDSHAQMGQLNCSLEISPSGQSTRCAGSTTGTCQHKCRLADPAEILSSKLLAD
jgi:hypothetical protein